jgi:DNA-binding transcriptional regulator GbsR (MarR family)
MVRLTPVMRKFILHWGEMGTRWGVNRTVAQIHALLYLWPEPLNAEQIAQTLSIARSNVSNSLKELQSWRIVRVVPRMGDRRDYYASMTDVWDMFRIILDERRKRETEPTLAVLRECVAEAEQAHPPDSHVPARLRAMLDFFETMTAWYLRIRQMPTGAVVKFVKLGDKVRKLVGLAS